MYLSNSGVGSTDIFKQPGAKFIAINHSSKASSVGLIKSTLYGKNYEIHLYNSGVVSIDIFRQAGPKNMAQYHSLKSPKGLNLILIRVSGVNQVYGRRATGI